MRDAFPAVEEILENLMKRAAGSRSYTAWTLILTRLIGHFPMLAVVQRVSEARVDVPEAGHTASIGAGLCVLLGVEEGDGPKEPAWMAKKLANLRIFRDDQGKMNRSVRDIGGEVMLISQFTLAGDCSAGNRPSFIQAAPPEIAEPLYEQVVHTLRAEHELSVATGVFGGMMNVALINDGPVTLIVRSRAESAEC